MKKILSVVFLLLVLLVLPKTAFAEKEFATSYDVNYNVGQDGVTEVVQKISLKNLTDKFYASNFSLSIGSTTVSEVSASNTAGEMSTKIDSADGKTTITVNFNQQVTGIDKAQTFILRFKSRDFAESIGKTWQVDLPRIPDNANIDQYTLTLNVPVSFGDPTSVYPKPASEKSNYDLMSFVFNKDQLVKTGVSINFGTNQVFEFKLDYKLNNNFFAPATGSIIIPSDTNFQDIQLDQITPSPEYISTDPDGNYLAWYKVAPRSNLSISVSGLAKLYINSKPGSNNPLTPKETQSLTKQDKFWEKDNPALSATLKEIFKNGTPKTNQEKSAAIYQYVVRTLKYDSARVQSGNLERLGALTALNNPEKAVCMEFTDLFIALARGAGIPARELDGFAYSQNKDLRPLSFSKELLHAWAEYFDPARGWVMVDPTWENTSGGVDYFNKFDLNHFTMAIRGASSEMNFAVDQVDVKVSDKDFSPQPKLDIITQIPDSVYAGLPTGMKITIKNSGNALYPSSIIKVNTKNIDSNISEMGVLKFAALPPLGQTEYNFELRPSFSWQQQEAVITIQAADQTVEKVVIIKPIYQSALFLGLIVGGITIIVLGYGGVLAYHLYRKRA